MYGRILFKAILATGLTFTIHIAYAYQSIQLMTYNVENLFDTEHDAGKDDWYFLPKNYPGKNAVCARKSTPEKRQRCYESDWQDSRLNIKYEKIKLAVMSTGRKPDILALQEVENIKVLKSLAMVLGYDHYILEEADDRRGIDVALMYNDGNLTYLRHQSHALVGKAFVQKPTRDILSVQFRVGQGKAGHALTVYVNHWPSQMAPASKRLAVAKALRSLIDFEKRLNPASHIVAMGDFNTKPADWPHPFKEAITNRSLSHPLSDCRYLAKSAGNSYGRWLGTYFYPPLMEWQHLDRIFISRNLHDKMGLEFAPDSYRIVVPPMGSKSVTYDDPKSLLYGSVVKGAPDRYDFKADSPIEAGYSDHYPVVIELAY